MKRTGACLCGAVKYEATGKFVDFTVCHCGMCRRWAGGPLMSTMIDSIEWTAAAPKMIQSSDWAERGFCDTCGSVLFYRLTAEGPYHGNSSITLGSLDDPSGLALTKEWFIDKKPDAYSLTGDHVCVTEAEAFAMLEDA